MDYLRSNSENAVQGF